MASSVEGTELFMHFGSQATGLHFKWVLLKAMLYSKHAPTAEAAALSLATGALLGMCPLWGPYALHD